jgi:hypothetical protein
MRWLTDAEQGEVESKARQALRAVVWDAARRLLEDEPEEPPVERHQAETATQERAVALAELRVLEVLRDLVPNMADLAALDAAIAGVDYAGLGEAVGITRQAARQRWGRRVGSAMLDRGWLTDNLDELVRLTAALVAIGAERLHLEGFSPNLDIAALAVSDYQKASSQRQRDAAAWGLYMEAKSLGLVLPEQQDDPAVAALVTEFRRLLATAPSRRRDQTGM